MDIDILIGVIVFGVVGFIVMTSFFAVPISENVFGKNDGWYEMHRGGKKRIKRSK
jgi:hypothetical protein